MKRLVNYFESSFPANARFYQDYEVAKEVSGNEISVLFISIVI